MLNIVTWTTSAQRRAMAGDPSIVEYCRSVVEAPGRLGIAEAEAWIAENQASAGGLGAGVLAVDVVSDCSGGRG